MKTLFTLLSFISFMTPSAFAFAPKAWTSEKCNTIEQTPDVLLPGNFSRILVMRPEEGYDVVLLMKTKETGKISALSLGFEDGSEKTPRWHNGNIMMAAEFEKDLYHLYLDGKKFLTMECPFL